jgi:hypothetical protein
MTTCRPCIGGSIGYVNTFVNNIAYAIPSDRRIRHGAS